MINRFTLFHGVTSYMVTLFNLAIVNKAPAEFGNVFFCILLRKSGH